MVECFLCLNSQAQTFVDLDLPLLDDGRTFEDAFRLHLPFIPVIQSKTFKNNFDNINFSH